ncbi:hypothetical protein JCM3775_003578 [Rhodotorula graminis]
MDDTITLRTSDDPPVELKAARAVLTSGSKVFSDMFSLPQGASSTSQGTSIDVAEKEAEIKPFLRLLNLSHEEGDPFKELDVNDWPVVAKLADKYDSATVRAIVLCKCWSWSTPATNAIYCKSGFVAAAELGQPHLAKVFMLRVMLVYPETGYADTLKGRQAQFDKWDKLLKAHAAMCALEASGINLCPKCAVKDPSLADTAWARMMRMAMKEWTSHKAALAFNRPVWGVSQELRSSSKICATCKTAFDNFANSLDEHFRNTAPEFPL